MPRRAPELLNGLARRGAAGMRRVACRGWEAPSGNPVQKRGAQGTSGIRVAFLLVTFLWPNKEKLLGCRSEHRHTNQPSRQRHNYKPMTNYQEILKFWFEETPSKLWWSTNLEFDKTITHRFESTLQQAITGELFAWRQEPEGRLAEVIVIDQFSRNIYRNSPLAFAYDPLALVLAQEAIAVGADLSLSSIERSFLYLPFMHSESKIIHAWAEKLYRENGLPDNYQFELKHKAIVDRFGRYPHRNQILGRTSTVEELEFLKQPGSSF